MHTMCSGIYAYLHISVRRLSASIARTHFNRQARPSSLQNIVQFDQSLLANRLFQVFQSLSKKDALQSADYHLHADLLAFYRLQLYATQSAAENRRNTCFMIAGATINVVEVTYRLSRLVRLFELSGSNNRRVPIVVRRCDWRGDLQSAAADRSAADRLQMGYTIAYRSRSFAIRESVSRNDLQF